jgi:2,4-dienoyl-CoA reductase-like NADH-dependent reductase (Old Yellow Enzyme family)/thioredoxin reductase
MSRYPLIFQPGRLGAHSARNRLVMPPIVRNWAETDGCANDRYVQHVERVARGGVGAIVLEAAYVSPDGKGFAQQLSVHDDACVPGLRRLAEAAHRHGALIGPQLYHAGRQTSSRNTGQSLVAPSAIADPLMNELPRELTVAEIEALVTAFGAAGRRALDAGCDLVEVHAAHGYLITQFLSPSTNRRDDGYGGDFDRRLRFLLEIVAALKAQAPGLAVLVRLSADEMVPGGLVPEDTVRIAERLESAGVDALHVSACNYASFARGMMIQPMSVPDGALLPLAAQVRAAVSIPVIAVGKIRTPELAESALAAGQADFIAIGRPLLADPDWPAKAAVGRAQDIRPCIACNQACIDRLFNQHDVGCTVNPECGHEGSFAQRPATPRRIVVVGAGPAGMQAAITAAERGHTVHLLESAPHPGGQLPAAAAAPLRPGWRELDEWLQGRLAMLGVVPVCGTVVTGEAVRALQPDGIVLATGARPQRGHLPGVHRNVVQARDLLEGRVQASGNVVVAGGGCSGAQTAEFLAARGHAVSLVEKTAAIAGDAPLSDQFLLIGRLQGHGVRILTHTRIVALESAAVLLESATGAVERTSADTVVICLGAVACNDLYGDLSALSVPVEVVGDARAPRKVTEAIAEGAQAVLGIERELALRESDVSGKVA